MRVHGRCKGHTISAASARTHRLGTRGPNHSLTYAATVVYRRRVIGAQCCAHLQTLSGQNDQTNVAKHQVGELQEQTMSDHVVDQASCRSSTSLAGGGTAAQQREADDDGAHLQDPDGIVRPSPCIKQVKTRLCEVKTPRLNLVKQQQKPVPRVQRTALTKDVRSQVTQPNLTLATILVQLRGVATIVRHAVQDTTYCTQCGCTPTVLDGPQPSCTAA